MTLNLRIIYFPMCWLAYKRNQFETGTRSTRTEKPLSYYFFLNILLKWVRYYYILGSLSHSLSLSLSFSSFALIYCNAFNWCIIKLQRCRIFSSELKLSATLISQSTRIKNAHSMREWLRWWYWCVCICVLRTIFSLLCFVYYYIR